MTEFRTKHIRIKLGTTPRLQQLMMLRIKPGTASLPRLMMMQMILLLMITALAATSCVSDDDRCPTASESDPEPVKLRFTIVTREQGSSTRTAGGATSRAPIVTGEQPGTPAENYLDIAGRDIRFLLFDGDRKLLREFTPDADIAAVDGSNYVTYTVRATIAEPYFAQAANSDVSFYIMVIANGNSHAMNAFGLAPGVTTIADIAGQLVSFTLATTYHDPVTGDETGWRPSAPGTAGGRYIPMSGLQKFSLSKGTFTENGKGPEGFVDLSPETGGKEINMLRALAKIEVADRIGIADGTIFDENDKARLYVEKVELLGYCPTGTMLPAYSQWNTTANGISDRDLPQTQQVSSATLPSPMLYREPSADLTNGGPESARINFHEDKEAKNLRDDRCPVFSVYVPEYSYASLYGKTPPYLRITVKDPKSTAAASVYPLVLRATKADGSAEADPIPELLRNHIYRYSINAIGPVISFAYTVCPWETVKEVEVPEFD